MKMNVLLICKLANHTLEENVLLPLLFSKNVDNIFVLRDFDGDFQSDRVKYLSIGRTKGKLRHIKKVFNALTFCRKHKIGAIVGVLNSPHAYIGRFLGKILDIPFVYMTIAGHREFWLGGKKKEQFNLKYFKKSPVVTVTGGVTKNYLLKNGYSEDKIFVLPNLPNEKFLSVEKNFGSRRYDIISFSRIDLNKNLILLVKAMSKLKDKYPNLKIAIAGDGDQLDNIKNSVIEYRVQENFEFLGYIKDFDDKVKLLSDSEIFISCSRGEGFPISLIEAMLCGCVPIVSNVGDIVDVINTGVNGYVFDDFDNETELVGILDKVLANRDKNIYSLRENCYSVKNNISVKNNAMVWDNIFDKIKR